MANVRYLRAMRDKAARGGDRAQVRALDADLDRAGASSQAGRSYGPSETTATRLPERAVPPGPAMRSPGRPALPRCEHGTIVGRCRECGD